ncbi:hypothetical protein N9S57_00545 [Luminiphilus sp.]|nr:sarcosine oxidase subunit gamma family protein [Luminiphilus sp.]MDA9625241.1 hypothetical protein [Luminiphilus sp.]MDA9666787.1 hypothetical protein [Luminiphilus sp.]
MSRLSSPLGARHPISGVDGLALRDLSLQQRSGVRGAGASAYLVQQSYPLPNAPNQLVPTDSGGWVMSLSHREFWLLQPDQEAIASAMQGEALAADVWPLYCQHGHAWLQLAGAPRAEVMATLCGVDVSQAAFPEGSVVQTQVARVTSIIAHHAEGQASVFSLFVDQSLAVYLWEALEDAITAFRSST